MAVPPSIANMSLINMPPSGRGITMKSENQQEFFFREITVIKGVKLMLTSQTNLTQNIKKKKNYTLTQLKRRLR